MAEVCFRVVIQTIFKKGYYREAVGEAMSEWQGMQQKPKIKLRDLLKAKKAKIRKLSELFKIEQNKLAKLNAMLDELRCAVCISKKKM